MLPWPICFDSNIFCLHSKYNIGVYQFLIHNGAQMVERTAYITLEQDQIPFHRAKPPEYLYVNKSKKVKRHFCILFFRSILELLLFR